MLNNCDLSIDQNNHDYDICHNQAALRIFPLQHVETAGHKFVKLSAEDEATVEPFPACFKYRMHLLSKFTLRRGMIVVLCTLLYFCKIHTVIY